MDKNSRKANRAGKQSEKNGSRTEFAQEQELGTEKNTEKECEKNNRKAQKC